MERAKRGPCGSNPISTTRSGPLSHRLRQDTSAKAETLTNQSENIIVKDEALNSKARRKTRQWVARKGDQ